MVIVVLLMLHCTHFRLSHQTSFCRVQVNWGPHLSSFLCETILFTVKKHTRAASFSCEKEIHERKQQAIPLPTGEIIWPPHETWKLSLLGCVPGRRSLNLFMDNHTWIMSPLIPGTATFSLREKKWHAPKHSNVHAVRMLCGENFRWNNFEELLSVSISVTHIMSKPPGWIDSVIR